MESINRLAREYKETKNQRTFESLYKKLQSGWWGDRRKKDIERFKVYRHEVFALYDDIILDAFLADREILDYNRYWMRSLEFARGRLYKRITKLEREAPIPIGNEEEGFGDADAPTFDIADQSKDPQEVLSTKEKARTQRQLISELVALSDDFTQMVVRLFPRYRSVNALAKALGEHPYKVRRSITRMSRKYDANRYGSIYDLLA